MSIKLKPNPTFWHEIKLTVPGVPEPVVISMELTYMTAEQFSVFFEEIKPKPLGEALQRVVIGWAPNAVLAEDGTYVPFSKEAFITLLNSYQASGSEIWRQWHAGLTESRVKN